MLEHGVPEHVRSDNGAEMTAERVRKGLETLGTESFNGELRDECLNGEIFYSLREAQVIVGMWRTNYSTKRPHSSLWIQTASTIHLDLRSLNVSNPPPFAWKIFHAAGLRTVSRL
jgi:transposase InsO family protein